MDALTADLGSDDLEIRARAQSELNQMPPSQLNALRRAAETARNPEARARLAARADALFELQLTDPPHVALDVAEVDAGQLAEALGKAIGMNMTGGGKEAQPAARFTLKAQASFWELRRQLSRDFPIDFGADLDRLYLCPDDHPQLQAHVVRGFCLGAGELQWGLAGVRPPDAKTIDDIVLVPEVRGLMTLGVDPRIRLAQVGRPEFSGLYDNQQYGWADHTIGTEKSPEGRQIKFLQPIAFRPGEKHGSSLSLRGRWPIDILLQAEHSELTDLSGPPTRPIRIEDVEIQFQKLEHLPPEDGYFRLNLKFSVRRLNATLGPPMALGLDVLSRNGTLLDSLSLLSHGGSSAAGMDRLAEHPAKIVFTLPTQTRRCWIPFEFNDLRISGEPAAPARLPVK